MAHKTRGQTCALRMKARMGSNMGRRRVQKCAPEGPKSIRGGGWSKTPAQGATPTAAVPAHSASRGDRFCLAALSKLLLIENTVIIIQIKYSIIYQCRSRSGRVANDVLPPEFLTPRIIDEDGGQQITGENQAIAGNSQHVRAQCALVIGYLRQQPTVFGRKTVEI